MSHDHHHHGTSNLKIAFVLNLLFVLVEIAGGYWTNSVAIFTDALHDAGDCFALGLAWYLENLSHRVADAKFTYGYRRFSSIGALVTCIVLSLGLVAVVAGALPRLAQPAEVHAPGMLLFSLVGIAVNGWAAWRLHGGTSLNEHVASWHLLEDLLGWVAVLVGSAIMMIWDVPIIDPLLAIGISIIILWNVVRNLRRVAWIFLQTAPPGFDAIATEKTLMTLEHVVAAHHIHTWTLDGESHVLSAHLVLDRACTRQQIVALKSRIHELLRSANFHHVTLDVELEGETCAVEVSGASTPGCQH